MPETDGPRAADWASMALEADRSREALLTLLWMARGVALGAETDEGREAARSLLRVVEDGMGSMRRVSGFLAHGRDRALEEETRRIDGKGAER